MAGEIFISYRRADQAWARLLHDRLKAEGVEAWYDALIGAGHDWRAATAQALEASSIFVLLFTASAAQSSDIAKELAAAALENKLIIPVRLENIAPKGVFLYELASRNWINAYENTGARLDELAKGLAHMVQTGMRDESVLPFERRTEDLRVAVVPARPQPRWTVEGSRPFISTQPLEGQPAFSPDGRMLAYTSGADPRSRKIHVRNVARGDGIRITADPCDDISPSWSSDGTRIAYIARRKGELCRIMVAAVPAGEAREVGRCTHMESSTVSWQPGTPFLYYFDRSGQFGHSIFRLDLDSGTRLQLPKAPIKEGSPSFQHIVHLQCSPDGRSLLYLWGATAAALAIVVRDLASGEERTLGHIVGLGGSAAWAEDSRAVLAATASGIGTAITAHPVDGSAPYRVYVTATRIGHLAAGPGGLLAIETDASRENLARAAPEPAAQPDIIDAAKGRSWAPTFAPDGTLAFLSNRSSTSAIWTMKPDSPPALLYDAGLLPVFRLEYAPDGAKLAAAIAQPNGITIKIVAANGAVLGSFDLPTLGYGHPSWTPDSKGVILFDWPRMQEVRVAIDDPARRDAAVEPPWCAVKVRPDGGVYCARIDKPGVWKIGSEPRLVSGKYPIHFGPPMTFRGDELLVPDFNAPEGARILAQPLAGGPDRVLAHAPGAFHNPQVQSKMAVNPETGEIIYVAAVQGDTGIDLLTLAQN